MSSNSIHGKETSPLSTLVPQLDSEWLPKLDSKPTDEDLRNAYFAALDAAGDPRVELARLEKRVSELDLGAPGRSALKRRRNELRTAISAEWRDRFGFGTRPGCDKALPWPEDAATRWLSIYEFIEECRGVWLPDEAKLAFSTHDSSVTAWEKLIEAVRSSNEDYWALFRDSISLSPVPGYSRLYSLMVAGEDDFHWAVEEVRRGEVDPPVHGLNFDYDTGEFAPSRNTSETNYTSFARVTDFVRVMFTTYDDLGRRNRFIYQGSKAPAKLYLSWGKVTIRRPTADELETAKFKDKRKNDLDESSPAEAIIDVLWDMDYFDAPEDVCDVTETFGALGFNDDQWRDLIAMLEPEWEIELEPDVSYKMLTIEDLAKLMKPLGNDLLF